MRSSTSVAARGAAERANDDALARRTARAWERQREHQAAKAAHVREQGLEARYITEMLAHVASVREWLARFGAIPRGARVLEVGSGAHGLVFFFGAERCVGCDPLAADYVDLFPAWQRRVPTLVAAGERLPFAGEVFDVVLCDNVVDHAADPAGIVRELARVMAPGGLLYFSVNFHHPLYRVASRLHAAWNAAGLRLEIAPFADHTVHLTLADARDLFRGVPLRVLDERTRRRTPRKGAHPWLKRMFFTNARYEAVAQRR